MRLPLLGLSSARRGIRPQPDRADWDAVSRSGAGQTVYWHAWGGSTTTYNFTALEPVSVFKRTTGCTLEDVKLTDTCRRGDRVLTERQAGEEADGAVDLIWNSTDAKFPPRWKQGGPVSNLGPLRLDFANWPICRDVDGKTVTTDFTVPTDFSRRT